MSSSSKGNVRAGIVDNALIVSFLSAEAPRVWRTDMGQFQNAALEVQENQGKFSLVMKRSGAAVEEIGTFTDKKSAAEALQLITEALLQGKEAPQTKTCGWFKKTLKFILSVLFVLVVLIVLVNIFGRHLPPGQNGPAKAPAVQTGIPTPADDIIGK